MSEELATDEAQVIESAETESVETTEGAATSETETQNSETVESNDEAGKASDEKRAGNGFQKRINELTRQRYEAEEARQQLEDEVRQLRSQAVQGSLEASMPRLEDYGYDESLYQQAMLQWTQKGVEEQQKALSEAEEMRRQQTEVIRKQQEIQRRMVEATVKYPDFMAKVNDPNLPSLAEINQSAYEALVESENMPDLAYYLANNPHEVYQFESMSPTQAVRTMVTLEQKITSPAKSSTAAPPPPSEVGSKAGAGKDPSKMSIDEWMEWRTSQL